VLVDNSEKILKTIQDNPGIYVREIMKKNRLSTGVVQYHLRKLEKNSLVKSDKRTRYKRYYSVDVKEEEFPIIANLRKNSKQTLLFAILSSDDPSFDDILHKIHKSPSTTSWNISGLIKDGIIEKVSKNQKKIYRVKNKELLRKTLHKEFSKLFHDSMEHDEDVFLSI
jgi:predicted transcriptional regulator